jgi:hypothetical protein
VRAAAEEHDCQRWRYAVDGLPRVEGYFVDVLPHYEGTAGPFSFGPRQSNARSLALQKSSLTRDALRPSAAGVWSPQKPTSRAGHPSTTFFPFFLRFLVRFCISFRLLFIILFFCLGRGSARAPGERCGTWRARAWCGVGLVIPRGPV